MIEFENEDDDFLEEVKKRHTVNQKTISVLKLFVTQDLDLEDLAEGAALPANDQLMEQRDNGIRGRGRGRRGRGRGVRAARPAPYQRPDDENVEEVFPEVNFYAWQRAEADDDGDVQLLEEVLQEQAPQVKNNNNNLN